MALRIGVACGSSSTPKPLHDTDCRGYVSIGREIAAFIDELAQEKKEDLRIANYRYTFINNIKHLSGLSDLSLADLNPSQVFQNILNSNPWDEEDKEVCFTLFNQLIEEVQTEK